MIKKFFFIISMFLGIICFAQYEQGQFMTQYYVNDMQINPAISGSKTYNPITLQTRQQWLGFDGAPLSSNVSYHGALNNRSAMGGYLLFNREYPFNQADFSLNYAYHIPLNYDQVNLSFGLGGEFSYANLDFEKGDLPIDNDPAFSANSVSKFGGNALFGTYLYGPNFYLGFSIFNLVNSGTIFDNKEYRSYYTMGAYRFNIMNNDWQFEPSFLSRNIYGQSSLNDLTVRILYLENTWASLAYRTNGTAIFGFGFAANNMHISYSYDHTFSGEIMRYNYGTHELGVSFRIETEATQRHIGFWDY